MGFSFSLLPTKPTPFYLLFFLLSLLRFLILFFNAPAFLFGFSPSSFLRKYTLLLLLLFINLSFFSLFQSITVHTPTWLAGVIHNREKDRSFCFGQRCEIIKRMLSSRDRDHRSVLHGFGMCVNVVIAYLPLRTRLNVAMTWRVNEVLGTKD